MEIFNKKNSQSIKFSNKSMKNAVVFDEDKNSHADINYKKSLGQNFIFDKNLLRSIASCGDVKSTDTVLEIGAGAGTLTEVLSEMSAKVISFEIDESLKPRLLELNKTHKNIEFHFQDFMTADLENLFTGSARVIANIPYYITTPIIFKLIEKKEKFKSILVLVQKEVAERFAASEGNKNYGITSVILGSQFDVTIPKIVKKSCFTPQPKVDSALVKLVPHNKFKISNFDEFKALIHTAFSMRRKTLVNNLKQVHEKEIIILTLKKFGLSENVRPEEISVEKFISIFEELKK